MTVDRAQLEAFWAEVDQELARYPAAPEFIPLPMRSSHEFSVWQVRLTSVGPYRISGYLSVPAGEGPFPGLLLTPRYGSVNHIPDYTDRVRYVCLQIHHRGQRGSDQPYAAEYPGLFTDGINDPNRYIYRGIVADCLRAAEALAGHPKVDGKRIIFRGDDLAVITAARRPLAHTVVADHLSLYNLIEHRESSATPQAEELNDWLRNNPADIRTIAETLALFDPLNHAAQISARLVLAADAQEFTKLNPLAERVGGPVERYELTHRGGQDRDGIDRLVAESLGVQPMSRFQRH